LSIKQRALKSCGDALNTIHLGYEQMPLVLSVLSHYKGAVANKYATAPFGKFQESF
jgi:hypothetical protein